MRFNALHKPWPLLLALLLGGRSASADDKVSAEILFEEGKKLLAEDKLEAACPKFAESQRLDPGVGTLLYLAECYERSGKLASAWIHFRLAGDLASQTNQPARAKVAREHAERLVPRLIRVQIDVPAGSEVADLAISRNGTSVARPLWGSAVPVDPGPVEVIASASGRRSWKITIQGSAAGTLIVRVPLLEVEAAPVASAPVASAAPATSAAPPPPSSSPVARSGGTTAPTPEVAPSRTPWILAAGGVGLLGLGLGSYFGLKTLSTWDDAQSNCSNGLCNAEANRLSKEASSSSTLSTVFFAVGAVGLGAGVGLWLTAPSSSTTSARVSPAVGPGLAGLSMKGSF
jgi:hypothetical protein